MNTTDNDNGDNTFDLDLIVDSLEPVELDLDGDDGEQQ